MLNFALAAIIIIILFALLSLSVTAGRLYGKQELVRDDVKQLEVVTVAEGAVFTLLALLVAFAFSGAYERFENRKLHVMTEAEVVDDAYKGLDLLAPATQPPLRQSLRDYIDAQLAFYKSTANFKTYNEQLHHSEEIEKQIWSQALYATKLTNDGNITQLFLPLLTKMFDEETEGMEMTRVHPPVAIFALLIALAGLSGFLAGYSTANSKKLISLHIFSYVAITAFTIYIIIDLEFPRVGMIRVDAFDHILQNFRHNMD